MASKIKIYTRTGDTGQTSLYGGKRVGKDDPRVEAYGTVDEFNSALGVLIAHVPPPSSVQLIAWTPRFKDDLHMIHAVLTVIQSDLFIIGAHLAGNAKQPLQRLEKRVKEMEQLIDALDEKLPPLKNFILPGGSIPAAFSHLARSICRRAERAVIHLSRAEDVAQIVIQYLNRLSDLLFVLARYLNLKANIYDTIWSTKMI